ncbi:MAG TPA: hypothetical protein VG735_06845 [Caulobacterales bacterium]|jgi:hypothetical protein|nr:hypothetical protein [Caulobacterales bacterium]
MSFDFSKVISELGDDVIAKCGEPLGLDRDKSVRVAHALAARFNLGGEAMIKAAAEDTGIAEDAVSDMSKKLIEAGKEKLMDESGASAAIEKAKADAAAAAQAAASDVAKKASGMFGKLFGG